MNEKARETLRFPSIAMRVLNYRPPDDHRLGIAASHAGLSLVALGAANWLPVLVMFLYIVIGKEIKPQDVSLFWWGVLAWCALAAIVQTLTGAFLNKCWSTRASTLGQVVNACSIAVLASTCGRLAYAASSLARGNIVVVALLVPSLLWVGALIWSSLSLRRIDRAISTRNGGNM